jgi:Rrf2 family protein
MTKVLRISEAASLAIHTMVVLATDPTALTTTRKIAESLNVSEAHLSKVLQRLSREGLVRTVRGPSGGAQLAKPAKEITLLKIYEVIEGPLDDNGCLLEDSTCNRESCIFGSVVSSVGRQIRDYMAKTTIHQLVE